MTAARKPAAQPSPLAILELRAWARATLYAAGEIDLPTAVDALQAAAERDGLVERLGQNRVQALMATAFHAVARRP